MNRSRRCVLQSIGLFYPLGLVETTASDPNRPGSRVEIAKY